MITPVSDGDLFSLLPSKRPPWIQFSLSLATHSLAIVAVVWLGALHLETLPQAENSYRFIPLLTKPPANLKPAPLRVIKAPALVEPRLPALRLLEEVRHQTHPDNLPAPPKVALVAVKPEVMPTGQPLIPRQLVKTNVFSSGSSATPTIAAAPQKVQTGGFGDPNGVPAQANNGKAVNIAQVGSFDLPSGPGNGNGSAGEKGARGIVASAGFGSGTAIGDGSGSRSATRGNAIVQRAGFGDVAAVTPAEPPKTIEKAALKTVSAEIVSKPNPVYTDEARKLHIEGEVLLQVVLELNGKVRVVRVVRGLGHGLDEAAMRAAEQIRFRPAQQDGQPVDFPAVLHIRFQLT